jgi:hypothetical protein
MWEGVTVELFMHESAVNPLSMWHPIECLLNVARLLVHDWKGQFKATGLRCGRKERRCSRQGNLVV